MKIYYQDKRYLEDILENREYVDIFKYPVVIDIGANIGAFSLYVYDFCDEVYALEPVKENLDIFRKTIQENNLTRIKTYQEAIAGETGVRNIRKCGPPSSGAWTIVDASGPEHEYRRINAITLKDFMDREKIEFADLVKIDVESAEGEILEDKTFPFAQIDTIVGEFHNNWASGKDHDRLVAVLKGNGFIFEGSGKGHFLARKL